MPGVVNSYAARFGTAGTVPESALRAAASDCRNSRKRALTCRRYSFGYPSTETQNTDEHRVTAFKLCGAKAVAVNFKNQSDYSFGLNLASFIFAWNFFRRSRMHLLPVIGR